MIYEKQPDKIILTLENEKITQIIIYSSKYVKAHLDKIGRLHITIKQ